MPMTEPCSDLDELLDRLGDGAAASFGIQSRSVPR